jgi:hypothetical protein
MPRGANIVSTLVPILLIALTGSAVAAERMAVMEYFTSTT